MQKGRGFFQVFLTTLFCYKRGLNMSEKILDDLQRGVLEMDEELTEEAAKEALLENLDPLVAINDGLLKGMNEAGRLFEEEEYFVPELLLCSDALYAGLEIFSPVLQREEDANKLKAVIGVVQGDAHDIGKNLVKLMLDVAGFEVYDLGKDVHPGEFVKKVREVDAHLLCLSTLMSTTMGEMEAVINILVQAGLRDRVTVMVGGGPVSQAFATKIGADGYANNANNAVRVAKELLTKKGVVRVGQGSKQ